MTIKHISFAESEVMQSLTKIAYDKKLIDKNTSVTEAVSGLKKTAKARCDLTPGSTFDESVLKLCAGLRAKGLESQAHDIESKFIQLKASQHLYSSTSEKDGENFLHSAHPEGSPKVSDSKGDHGVVEDQVEQRKKMLGIVNKSPTGKLSTAEVIQMVKMVFASLDDELENVKKAIPFAEEAVSHAQKVIESVKRKSKKQYMSIEGLRGSLWGYTTASTHLDAISSKMSDLLGDITKSASVTLLDELKQKIEDVKRVIVKFDPENLNQSSKDEYIAGIDYAMSKVYAAINYLKGEVAGGDFQKNFVMSNEISKHFDDLMKFIQTHYLDKKEQLMEKLPSGKKSDGEQVLFICAQYVEALKTAVNKLNSAAKMIPVKDVANYFKGTLLSYQTFNSVDDVTKFVSDVKAKFSSYLV